MGAIALIITRWLVDRWPDDLVTPSPSDTKAYDLQDQVNSKILWDAPEYDVLEWLEGKHSITGDQAQQMLRIGDFSRRRAIREKALYASIATLLGLVVSGGLLWLQIAGGYVFIFWSIVLVVVFGFCGIWFTRYEIRHKVQANKPNLLTIAKQP
jgi:hypothetical protein